MISNSQLELAFNFIQFTNKNVFLTGKAGTGKTTFLHSLRERSFKRMIVVAPTGVAALNAGGVTIHSFFQMPFGPFVPRELQGSLGGSSPYAAGITKISRSKIAIIRSLDLLVIDEISMVRADLLDGVDEVLRRYRDRSKPFGGVQLLMIGDIQQLSPVVKGDEWRLLREYYNTAYFFDSRALQKTDYVSIELKHIFRQSDKGFIDLLNNVRENRMDNQSLLELNKRHQPGFKAGDEEGYITLTTHNSRAQEINQAKLNGINNKAYTFEASVKGEFPEYSYPTGRKLVLKTGAQVMFVKNDSTAGKRYFNGKIGKIVGFDFEENYIIVRCKGDTENIEVGKEEWKNCKYTINPESKNIEEEIAGSFLQHPLKLAWAITIHKSQGLTFEKAVIDANASFAHGQVYVALSRCTSLEGIVLSSPITETSIKNDITVLDFSRNIENNPPDETRLQSSKREYLKELIIELFSFNKILSAIYFCQKVTNENATALLGFLPALFRNMNSIVKTEIDQVSEKFRKELESFLNVAVDVETDRHLKERISRASAYFEEKIIYHILKVLEAVSIQTDNKQVKKDVKNAVERLYQETIVRQACLHACLNGFILKEYLTARAVASIGKAEIKTPKIDSGELSASDVKYPALFTRLREWRIRKAADKGLPAYMVLHQKVLIAICSHLPGSLTELLTIKGFGKKKVKEYGEEILQIIEEFCQENNIEFSADFTAQNENEKAKKPKADTKLISLEMFRRGKSIAEIASERGFAVSTIEGHLAHYIEIGEIDILQMVDEETVGKIASTIRKNNSNLLSEVKDELGEWCSYGQIKMVIAYLKSMEIKN